MKIQILFAAVVCALSITAMAAPGGGFGGPGGGRGPTQPGRPGPQPQPQPRPQPGRSDAQCYLDRYPDICINSPKNYCRNPWNHFISYGRNEGRVWGCQ